MADGKFMALARFPVGAWMFQALLPAKPGKTPDNPRFAMTELMKLERAATVWIAENVAISKETVRFLRSQAGLTQAALAELLDVDARTVARWEAGETVIDRARFDALARLALEHGEGDETTLSRLRAEPVQRLGEIDLKVA